MGPISFGSKKCWSKKCLCPNQIEDKKNLVWPKLFWTENLLGLTNWDVKMLKVSTNVIKLISINNTSIRINFNQIEQARIIEHELRRTYLETRSYYWFSHWLYNLWLHIWLHHLWLHIWLHHFWLRIWLHHLWLHMITSFVIAYDHIICDCIFHYIICDCLFDYIICDCIYDYIICDCKFEYIICDCKFD